VRGSGLAGLAGLVGLAVAGMLAAACTSSGGSTLPVRAAGSATGPAASSSPAISVLPTGVPTTTTTSPTGRAAPPPGCATPHACGFPDASTTGYRLKTLTPHTGDTAIRTDGQVISGWDLKGSLDIYADDVTIIDSRITSTNWWAVNVRQGHHGLRVLHSTLIGSATAGPDNGGVDYGVSDSGTAPLEVGWCDLSHFGEDLAVSHGDIHDDYTHDQAMFVNQGHEWQHTDALISGGADTAGLVIRHNTLINDTPIDKGASGGVGLFDDDGPVSATVVDGNWIAGGAYALYGGDTGATGIKVTNNVFATQVFPNGGYYGFVAKWNAGGAGNVWSGNRTVGGAPVRP
jgi:hypothetical protein